MRQSDGLGVKLSLLWSFHRQAIYHQERVSVSGIWLPHVDLTLTYLSCISMPSQRRP